MNKLDDSGASPILYFSVSGYEALTYLAFQAIFLCSLKKLLSAFCFTVPPEANSWGTPVRTIEGCESRHGFISQRNVIYLATKNFTNRMIELFEYHATALIIQTNHNSDFYRVIYIDSCLNHKKITENSTKFWNLYAYENW